MRILGSMLAFGAVMAAMPAMAGPIFLATGTLGGSSDLSGLTGTLENGQAANVLGGLGSGLAYAGNGTFLALPDRGPNAITYADSIDNTTSYITRFHTLTMGLTASSGGGLPFTLTPTLTGTTLLSSPTALLYGTGAGLTTNGGAPIGSGAPAQNSGGVYYFTGRSDGYGAGNSTNPADARFDPESIRVSNDGRSVFISDEYGPYVRQFDRATGSLIRTYALPANLSVANLSPVGNSEISGNTSGRTANKGMEGLSITPDGTTLVGIMQAPLIGDGNKLLRIVTIDIASGETHEYGYKLTTGSGVSEIVAINSHQFLVDERDGKGLGDGSAAAVKQVFMVDIAGATEITNVNPAPNATAAVAKTLKLDLVAALQAAGIDPTQIPSKIEGLTFGADVTYNGQLLHTLYIANDNDFLPDPTTGAGPNRFYVFGFSDADLPGFTAQALTVPEPATWATMVAGFALAGAMVRRRKRAAGAIA